MKIAFVYDAVYPFVKGGAEKRVWELATRLTNRGHEVHLFCLKFWDGEKILVRDGIILHGVCPAEPLYVSGRRSFSEAFRFGFSVTRPLERERFDIIDCQQFPYFSCFSARFVASVTRTPLVITWLEVWGDYWYEYLGWRGWFGRQTERMVARLSARHIAISESTADRYETCFGKPAHAIIPIGIDIGKIRAILPSKETSDIIFIGRLIKEKHVDLLIRAFFRVVSDQPGLKLLIVGEGPERGDLSNLITELKLHARVEFKPFSDSHDEIIGLMKSSRVFVIPSTREGFGITALEALACGIPVVTVNDPANAIRNLIIPGTGLLCALDEEDIAEKIKTALEMGSDMRDACEKSAESFEWDRIVIEMEKLYTSLAGQ